MTYQPRRYGLSKSKITAFEQCPKRLWLSVHRRDLAEQDEGAEARFATGHEVGAIACALLPDGVLVDAEPDLAAALATTRALLDGGHDRPIFEATLEHDGVLVRIDVLEPDGAGGWHMAEVKSSTKAKDYHVGDLATQLWVARNAGVPVTSAAIRHIDSSFVLEREGEFEGVFVDTDLMSVAEPVIATRAEVVRAARKALAGGEPDIAPGDHCNTPFSCEFADYCHKDLPVEPEWPVEVLPGGAGKKWRAAGILDLRALDPTRLKGQARRVHAATMAGVVDHDSAGAAATMAGWAFPRTWLDFETIQFALPRWIGTRPYEQIPFQFTAIVEEAGGGVATHEFLQLDGADPRRACAEALAALPRTGAVIAYNAAFERGVIRKLATAFVDLAPALDGLADRLVDLLPVTRAHWYHPDQRGSWSLKAVLPTIAPALDYAALEVKDGGGAQEAYLEAIGERCTAERRAALDVALRVYCGQDVEAMRVVARTLVASQEQMMRIEHEDFRAALAEARTMTDSELKKAARAGTSSSYYIQDGERQIPMKAVLRLAYIRVGQTWDGPQSKEAFEYLRGIFPVVYRPTAEALAEDEKRERVWVERLARGEQANFRRALITRDGACVLTGFSVLRALEAAHVTPVEQDGSDRADNGILLRADLHKLFDANLLAINPETGAIWLHESCREDYEELLNQTYSEQGKPPLAQFADRWTMRLLN